MNERKMNPYQDLEDRTTEFAASVIRLCRKLPPDIINNNYIDQISRSAGSVGANYREANGAESKADFLHKIKISRKELAETLHWLTLLRVLNPQFNEELQILDKESVELLNIFSKIIYKVSYKN